MKDFWDMYAMLTERNQLMEAGLVKTLARFEEDDLIVDTGTVPDSESQKSCETAIAHHDYNHGDWVVVEMYDDEDAAEAGHDRWVKTMTTRPLPPSLYDVCDCASFLEHDAACSGTHWRIRPKQCSECSPVVAA